MPTQPACAWFLEISFICVRMYVYAPRLLITVHVKYCFPVSVYLRTKYSCIRNSILHTIQLHISYGIYIIGINYIAIYNQLYIKFSSNKLVIMQKYINNSWPQDEQNRSRHSLDVFLVHIREIITTNC